MKKTGYIILTLILSLGIFGLTKSSWAATRYACNNISTCNSDGGSGWSGTPGTLSGCASKTNPCSTIKLGYNSMSSGDTLIIGNGIYQGTNNITTAGSFPPNGTYNGTAGVFTTVQAEVDWQVTIDGQNTNNMFNQQTPSVKAVYWRGIKWLNDSAGMTLTGNSNGYDSWIKFKNCAYQMYGTGSQGNWYISYTNNLLLEDVVSFGDARYGIDFFQCNNVVVRRAVVRLDAADGSAGGTSSSDCYSSGWPIAGIMNYDTQYSEYQNIIVLDSNDTYFTHFSQIDGAFDIRPPLTRGSSYINWRGCIGLNNRMGRTGPVCGWFSGSGISNGNQDNTAYFSNMILWGSPDTNSSGLIYPYSGNPTNLDRMTVGSVTGSGLTNSGGASVTNSIWTQITGTALTGSGIAYNDFYGNGSNGITGANSRTVNPLWSTSNPTGGLKYLPRIESGSNLSGFGSAGADQGASVIYKIGIDGTFYGQSGYNSPTSDSLWPYPNEDAIKTMMAGYSHSGGPVGARGFATGVSKDGSPQTLTKYIWEYLGNQIPVDIYGGSTPAVVYGDVSGDSTLSAYDASLAAQYAVSLITLTPTQLTAADVSGDGTVSAYDASLIAQKAVGLIIKFPVE